MVGLRGVGKTVLLNRMREDADSTGVLTIAIEAPEGRTLPAMLAPQLRLVLLRLSQVEVATRAAQRALRGLSGFVRALKLHVRYADVDVGIDFEPEPGLADNGNLETDLTMLLVAVGQAAREGQTAVVLFIDELQYVAEDELGSLISALHICTQQQLPVAMVGAGLPQVRGRAGEAKSYAERLFEYPSVGPLSVTALVQALTVPAEQEGVSFTPEAIAEIHLRTHGYPYFVQEWAKHSWDVADANPIDVDDVRRATRLSIAALDESFFRVRFDRLTPSEKRYLRAMAQLGPGPHRSGDIAQLLAMKVTSLGLTRANLIAKGMIWSPAHGDTAFTVPLFDEFMKRIIPGDDWRER